MSTPRELIGTLKTALEKAKAGDGPALDQCRAVVAFVMAEDGNKPPKHVTIGMAEHLIWLCGLEAERIAEAN